MEDVLYWDLGAVALNRVKDRSNAIAELSAEMAFCRGGVLNETRPKIFRDR